MLALATLIPFALLAVWVRLEQPAAWELAVINALALGADPAADIVRAVNTLGNVPVWAVVVALAALGAAVIRGLVAGLLIALSFASDLAALVVKIVVERERPETAAVQQFFGSDSFAFPSGHVVRAVALVAVVAWIVAPPASRLPVAVGAGALAAIVMGYARVALGVHWPTDAGGGALLGLAWFALTVLAVRRLRGRGMDLQHDVRAGA